MRTHISTIILLLGLIAILSACGIIRQDMFKPGDDTNKGSTSKITIDIGDGLVTSESGASDSFQAVLNEAPASDVTFPISSMDASEVAVSPSSVTFTTANWNIPQTVGVSGVDDALADNTQPVIVSIGAAVSGDSAWDGFDPPDVTVYNIDNDSSQVPGVTVSGSGVLLLSEGGGSGSFAVVLGASPLGSNSVTVPVSVSDSTEATITSPFSGASGSLVFTSANWSTPQVVLVRGVDDSEVDGNYAGSITIGVTSSGDPVYNGTFNPPDVSFTNVDNDAAGVTVTAGGSMVVSESGTSASFTVVLNSSPSGSSAVSIPVAVLDATEGNLIAPALGDLSFNATDWNVPRAVTVAGVDDPAADGNMIFTVALGAASSTDPNYNGIDPPDVTFTNVDDDAAGVTVNAGSSMLVSESGTDSSFTVVLNSQPMGNVTIPVSVSDATEGTITAPAPGGPSVTLTFTGVDWNVPKTLTVAGVRDALADGNQPFNVVIGTTSSFDFKYNGTINPPDVMFTCIDDYRPGVTVIAGSPMVVSESGTTASFQVVLNSKPTNDVTIPVSVTDSTEGVITAPFSGTILFTDTDWNVPKTITVSGVGDSLNDGDQGFNVVLGATSSADPIYNGSFGPTNVNYICIDESGPAAVIVIAGSPMMVSESGTSSSFQVVLASSPSGNVDIPLSISDATEGVISVPFAGISGTITFTPGNWNILRTVTVTGVKDALADGNQSFLADFGLTSSLDSNYNGLTVSDVTYVCIDDYSAGVTVNAGDPSTPMMVSESGTTSSFTVVLNSKPGNTVSIDIGVSDASEGMVTAPFAGTSGTMSFTTGNWNIPQTVTVMGMNDAVADGSQPFTLALSNTSSADPLYNGLATPDVSFINIDDDKPGITVNAGSIMLVSESVTSSSFTVVLNSQPLADVTIQVQVMDGSEGKVIAPFTGTSGVITFTNSNWNTAQAVRVEGVDDYEADGNQSFTVELMPAVSADPAYDTLDPNDVSFVNVDNDAPGITVNIGDGLITKEHPTAPIADTFKVVLNSAPTDDVTIGPIASLDPAEVAVTSTSLTFTPGNWNIAQDFTVKPVYAAVYHPPYRIVTVDLGVASSPDINYNGKDPGDVVVYNLDNESPPQVIIINSLSGNISSENGAVAQIPVVLSAMPTQEVTLPSIVSLDITEGSVITTSITFTSADWDCPHMLRVAGIPDGGRGDGAQLYTVDLGVTSSADLMWNNINGGIVSIKNLDYVSIPDYAWTGLMGGSWSSISSTGTAIAFKDANLYDQYSAPAPDEGYDVVPIGFTFCYMGMPYNEILVYTNGFASFNRERNVENLFVNYYLFFTGTDADLFKDVLAPWWDDLTTADAGSGAYYQTTGMAPTRVFTVEWKEVRQIPDGDKYNFQIKLYEKTHMVEFVYGPVTNASGNKSSASIGIKDSIGGVNHFRDGFNGDMTLIPSAPKYDQHDRTVADFPLINTVIRFEP